MCLNIQVHYNLKRLVFKSKINLIYYSMLFTFLFRLCTLIGICHIPDTKESLPTPFDLNSFTSKTAYRNSKLSELHDGSKGLANCQLVHINALFRHGTRFPGAKDMEKIGLIHKKIIASHARSILPKSFSDWKMPFSPKKEKALASVGYEEMMLLGIRFRSQLNKIDGYKNYANHVKVISSSLSRSKMSAVTFLKSFLDNQYSEKDVNKMVTENDNQLRFFKNCPHYTNTVLKGKTAKMEYKRFMNGPEMRRIVKDITQKWKLTDVDVTVEDVKSLYTMCGFEIATNLSSHMRPHDCPVSPAGDGLVVCPNVHKFIAVESSPLCSLLESDHYTVIEYLTDLKHYWAKSYAKEINWLQACALVSPMMQQVMAAARGHQAALRAATLSRRPLDYYLGQQTHLRAAFWFGHAETLLPVITLLDLFNQSSPMSASVYKQRLAAINDPRQRFSTFRVSNIAPFAGNVALELYHCPEMATTTDTRHASGYRVQVKSNEKAVAWPLANGGSHISLESFTNHLNLCLPEKYDHHAVCVQGMSSSQLHEAKKRGDEL